MTRARFLAGRLLFACLALGACDEQGARTSGATASSAGEPDPSRPPALDCSEPRAGCPCSADQPPVPCTPDGPSAPSDPTGATCFEGTRYCRGGRFGACEDVRAFAAQSVEPTALIDLGVEHARCDPCSPNCYRVVDNLDPSDGPLEAEIASGLSYHDSGGGLTLTPSAPLAPVPQPADLPPGALFLSAPFGLSASATHTATAYADDSDVYLLLDQSRTMAEETQQLYDLFESGALLAAGTVCADGSPPSPGLAGALRCLSLAPEIGVGMFRDLPFAPYAADQALPESERDADARRELAFRQQREQSGDLGSVRAAMAALGGVESSGDPDVAGSQIPALYAIATGQGFDFGLGRTPVPAGPSCGDGRFGYPCFREDSQPIVVLVTDAPMHDGAPLSAYDYDPAQLTALTGTTPGITAVPPTNGAFDTAFAIPGDAARTLAVFGGTTDGLDHDVPGGAVGCGAHDLAPNAVFRFEVEEPGPVRLTTEGADGPHAIAVFDRALPQLESGSENAANELFESAHDLGEVNGRYVRRSGSTRDPAAMSADYQSSLFGGACGANTLAPDAVYRFSTSASAEPSELEVTLRASSGRPVLSIYEEGRGSLPRWPAHTTTLVAEGNRDAYAANVYTIPSGPGDAYVTVRGDTTELGADFDASELGGADCGPDSASPDAAFRIHVEGTRTLRFDTEGSSFDTVLSLHETPPLTMSADVLVWPADETHGNGNEDRESAYETGPVNGMRQVFEGDTSEMRADVSDTFGCGMDGACGDAVYAIEVTERTTLRFAVSGTGFDPAVVVTREDPAGVSGRYPPFALGAEHSCALSSGQVFCWGADSEGQLGDGGGAGDPDALQPVRAAGLTSVVQIGAGAAHTCAVTEQGALYCWGEGSSGQLGDGAAEDRYAPVQVVDVGGSGALSSVVQVGCGRAHCCALREDGSVVCFGDNGLGQLGTGATSAPSATPVPVAGGYAFEQIAVNDDHACAIRAADDAVLCWGEGARAKMGDGSTANNTSPEQVTGLVGATHVIAGQDHNCAVLSSGRVACWGAGDDGRLGQDGETADRSMPVFVRDVDGSGLLGNVRGGFAGGRAHTCVTTLEGFALCWGDNARGQLGDGSTEDRHLPVGVRGLRDAVHVASAGDHGCALLASGELWCWGAGARGQLGQDQAVSAVPVRAHPGNPEVSFGSGSLDAAFTQACRSRARLPEPGCRRRTRAGRHYYFCTSHARTWAGAAEACAAAGYELVDIDETGENAFVAGQLDGRAWIGVRRESGAGGAGVSGDLDFVDLAGDEVWHTEVIGHDRCLWFFCEWEPTSGFFTPAAAPDLIDSLPYSSASTWANDEQPSVEPGQNCVALRPDGKWQTEPCAAPQSLSDVFAAPQFAGGAERDYVCEERERTTEVTLDPGRYYVTVKGEDDGDPSNACAGPYALTVEDLGRPRGGFLACDDNGVDETGHSVIERTLTEGDYYLVVKGKRASDRGPYQLTVRDVGAVTSEELGCDAGHGAEDPARVRFTAEPGRTYYALIKGDAPGIGGDYELTVRDASADAARLACDAHTGSNDPAELTLDLPAGEYYAVIKGTGPFQSGDFRLVAGGAEPNAVPFEPPGYDATIDALAERRIRVATVLTCGSGQACTDARAQAEQLAYDTGGVVRLSPDPAFVVPQILHAVRTMEALHAVRAELLFEPDPNPGFTDAAVFAVPDPGHECGGIDSAASFTTCRLGARPSFSVSLTHSALAPVLLPRDRESVQFTLRITGERLGATVMSEDVPVFVAPSGVAMPGSYGTGHYEQDFAARACGDADAEPRALTRPSWHALRFDADVPPDTRVSFHACTAEDEADLDACAEGAPSSGYVRVVTVTAGTGNGTPCTVQTEASDCPNGYCSPYTGICHELEGASCERDEDCPGTEPGRCRAGPSEAELGRTCRVIADQGQPSSALGSYDFLPFMRMRLELQSLGDRSRTPSVFSWEARYTCRSTE